MKSIFMLCVAFAIIIYMILSANDIQRDEAILLVDMRCMNDTLCAPDNQEIAKEILKDVQWNIEKTIWLYIPEDSMFVPQENDITLIDSYALGALNTIFKEKNKSEMIIIVPSEYMIYEQDFLDSILDHNMHILLIDDKKSFWLNPEDKRKYDQYKKEENERKGEMNKKFEQIRLRE